ncbi:L,D-transpeptidase family protein [Sphingomonas solaris]|uniref:L,D-transpeptidase family protein n=1 Tax=Alterirhizorhabdus solaris TaxID=2529389 RepID=A0A558R3D6_9SPHN|nr:L,D-transpeptidase family protein [Sphingomonas solaris]TVV73838.1 L,D-transpeptidase family protein [Sphingomonas solaris]
MTGGFGGAALRMTGRLLVGGAVLAGATHMLAPVAQAPVVAAAPAPRTAPASVPATPPRPMAAVATAVDAPFVVKRIMTLDGPLRHGGYAWDETGVPQGPLVVTVDIAAEVISVFRDGYEIGTAAIVYGAGNKPTPLGTFAISQKDANHVSSLYDAPMPYMMRLTSDGVAIHGSLVEWNAATHGCIGVPTPFAKLLFGQAKLGDRVIITNGKRLALGQAITT